MARPGPGYIYLSPQSGAALCLAGDWSWLGRVKVRSELGGARCGGTPRPETLRQGTASLAGPWDEADNMVRGQGCGQHVSTCAMSTHVNTCATESSVLCVVSPLPNDMRPAPAPGMVMAMAGPTLLTIPSVQEQCDGARCHVTPRIDGSPACFYPRQSRVDGSCSCVYSVSMQTC